MDSLPLFLSLFVSVGLFVLLVLGKMVHKRVENASIVDQYIIYDCVSGLVFLTGAGEIYCVVLFVALLEYKIQTRPNTFVNEEGEKSKEKKGSHI